MGGRGSKYALLFDRILFLSKVTDLADFVLRERRNKGKLYNESDIFVIRHEAMLAHIYQGLSLSLLLECLFWVDII